MIECTCRACRLIWREKRSEGDSPIHPLAFLCPRCGVTTPDWSEVDNNGSERSR